MWTSGVTRVPKRFGAVAWLAIAAATVTGAAAQSAPQKAEGHWAIVIHGGAGDIQRAKLGAQGDANYRAALAKVVRTGAEVLDRGGSSLDAVEAAIRILEDDPLFNSSRGAVFTAAGKTELDAAIMDGATLRAGSVADVTHTRYPITLARSVMEKTPYVYIRGPRRRCLFDPGRDGAGSCELFLHRKPLAVAGEATGEGRQTGAAAA